MLYTQYKDFEICVIAGVSTAVSLTNRHQVAFQSKDRGQDLAFAAELYWTDDLKV